MEISKNLVEIISLVFIGLSFLISIISVIIKRKPQTIDALESALLDCFSMLPLYVKTAEEMVTCEKGGDIKFTFVMKLCYSLIEKILGRSMTHEEMLYVEPKIRSQIEGILTAPSKSNHI